MEKEMFALDVGRQLCCARPKMASGSAVARLALADGCKVVSPPPSRTSGHGNSIGAAKQPNKNFTILA